MSWITGVCSPYFVCLGDFLHTMWSCKSLQLLCILPFGMLCLSAISMMFVNIMLAVCMLVGVGRFDTICTAVCDRLIASPLVGCVVWSLFDMVTSCILDQH